MPGCSHGLLTGIDTRSKGKGQSLFFLLRNLWSFIVCIHTLLVCYCECSLLSSHLSGQQRHQETANWQRGARLCARGRPGASGVCCTEEGACTSCSAQWTIPHIPSTTHQSYSLSATVCWCSPAIHVQLFPFALQHTAAVLAPSWI